MAEIPQQRQLFREAADIAIKLQNDPGNPAMTSMVRAWVARGPDHQAAWARVAAIHGMTGQVLTDQRKAAKGPSLSRRNLMIGGMLGLGGAAAGGWYGPDMLLRARADHLTGTAQQRRIDLPDGSIITLGPDSAISVHLTPTTRTIDLLQGMAFFEVAADPARPFTVRADHLAATALGTAFDVSLDAGSVWVSVGHGRVGVASDSISGVLDAGDWITLAPSAVPQRGHRDLADIASWRSGMLIAEQETVAALVARIARWQDGRVVIADPWLKDRVVSGVFDLGDPFAALQAAVRPFGAKVRKVTPFLTVILPL